VPQKAKLCLDVKKLPKDESFEYSVLPGINKSLGERTNIKVQDSKAKIFYFKSGQSDALISCFRDNINKKKANSDVCQKMTQYFCMMTIRKYMN